MVPELALRFLIGGAVVSAFAVAGDLFKPKTFSGIFGAAPSVALATLALSFAHHGAWFAQLEGRSMLGGAIALCTYSLAAGWTVSRVRVPAWLEAAALWSVWGAVAFFAALVLRRW